MKLSTLLLVSNQSAWTINLANGQNTNKNPTSFFTFL